MITAILDGYKSLCADTLDLSSMQHRVSKLRDLTIVRLLGDLILVIACDSNAGIGEKPGDYLKTPYENVGISMLKVPMMEVLASGASPVLIVNNLCVEMEPNGKKIISVMKQELKRCGFNSEMQLTGSTEDNAKTTQTGTGLTVVGIARESALRLGSTKAGDAVVCVGTPKDGIHLPYLERDADIASISTTIDLCRMPFVHEILPIGSHGALYEAKELAKTCGGSFRLADIKPAIELEQSAGPSTAVLVSLSPEDVGKLREGCSVPVYPIGTIESAGQGQEAVLQNNLPDILPAPRFSEQGFTPDISGILSGYLALCEDAVDFERMQKRVSRLRDLTLVDLVEDLVMVIACDSNAGCGEKPDDHFKWPYEMAVKSMLKVPLMETLAAGAMPAVIIDNLCVEMEPTGKRIIGIMREHLRSFGFNPDVQLTGSTEDNAKTTQTGTGLTIISFAQRSLLRLGKTNHGDTVVCVGVPKGGADSEYNENDIDIANVKTMFDLIKLPFVHEILPVGSHGVRYEAHELARTCGGTFHLATEDVPIRLDGSAGASTAVLVSIQERDLELLKNSVSIPVFPIGVIQ